MHPEIASAATFVRKVTPVTSTPTTTNPKQVISFGTAATVGNLVVIVCSVSVASNGNISNISVANYTVAAPYVSGGAKTVAQAIYYKTAVAGDTSATCGITGRPRGAITVQMYEYSGQTTSPFTASTTGTSSGTATAVSSGSATPPTGSSLVFAAISATGGTAFNTPTTGYTERTDQVTGLHIDQADLKTTTTTAKSYTATNSAASAWRGQIVIFNIYPEVLGADIVNGSGVSVGAPTVVFTAKTYDFVCQTNTATLGTATQKIRVSNYSATPGWALSIAPTAGPIALWSDGTSKFDVNDPTSAGCSDGSDSDTLGGQLTVQPSTASLATSGCATTGVSLGADTAFNEGVTDSVKLLTATSAASTDCYWDLTGVTLSQTIPAEQNMSATGYTLSLTLTILAQ